MRQKCRTAVLLLEFDIMIINRRQFLRDFVSELPAKYRLHLKKYTMKTGFTKSPVYKIKSITVKRVQDG